MGKKYLLAVLLLVVLAFGATALHVHRQFGTGIQYSSTERIIMPNGTYCIFHGCGFLESRLVEAFYLGEEITQENSTILDWYVDKYESNWTYYRRRGHDSLAVFIAQNSDGFCRIVRPSQFSSHCDIVGEPEHRGVFSAILRDIFACESAGDIREVRVGIEQTEETREKIKTRITDADTIAEILTILTGSFYDCGLGNCPDSEAARSLGQEPGRLDLSRYRVTLEFSDGSEFVFSMFDTRMRTLIFAFSDRPEALYLTEEQNTRLMELLEITV